MTPLSVVLFGALQCRVNTREVAFPARPGTRTLFAALAFATQPLRREWLAAALWPDVDDRTARTNLRRHLSYVEAWLVTVTGAREPLVRTPGRVALQPEVLAHSDVRAFEDALARDALDEAAALYAGDLLADVDGEWAAAERARYRSRYDDCLIALVRRARAANDVNAALRYASAGQALDPYDEGWLRTTMRLRYAAGDRSGALARYNAHRALIATELHAEPSRETMLLADSMRRGLDANAEPPLRATELTTFVGRIAEQRRLMDLLARSRIVTVSGESGIGKSRITLHVARQLSRDFSDGMLFVDAAAATNASELESALVRAAARSDEAAGGGVDLDALLAGQHALVLIDGCEHLHDACASLVRRLLEVGARVSVLASSRVALGVVSESVYRLPPMQLDDAAALFAERVTLARGDPMRPSSDAAAIRKIVRKLDGLPLAIELAASRTRTLTLAELERELHEMRDATAFATLHAMYEGSYRALAPLERTILGRLAVFSGWERAIGLAACADVADERETAAALVALVDRSLVIPPGVAETTPRYLMLDATREFALRQSSALGEREGDERAHARAIADHYTAKSAQLRSEHAADAYAQLERDRDNIERALATLWRGDDDDTMRASDLSLSVSRFWADQGYAREGERWLRRALEHAPNDTARRLELLRVIATLTRDLGDYTASFRDFCHLVAVHERAGSSAAEIAKAETMAGNAARMMGDYDEALRRIERAHTTFDALGETYLAAWAIYALGTTLLCAGRLDEAAMHLERATDRFNGIEALADTSSSIANLSLCHFHSGRIEIAHELAREATRRARDVGHRYYLAHALLNEALIENARGERDAAWAFLREAQALATTLDAHDVAISLGELTATLLAPIEPQRAAMLLGSVDRARQRFNAQRFPIDEPLDTAVRGALRTALGAASFEAILIRGRLTPLEISSHWSESMAARVRPSTL